MLAVNVFWREHAGGHRLHVRSNGCMGKAEDERIRDQDGMEKPAA